MARRRFRRILLIALPVLAFAAVTPMLVFDALGGGSVCRGVTSNGAVANPIRPPLSGDNYRAYCIVCALALRTYGHAPTVESVLEAYGDLSQSHPESRFVYGEIGFPWGGRFYPHKTHRNGLSFDFMVPLEDGALPTNVLNQFGYEEDFNAEGRSPAGRIDFAAIASHLDALDKAARARGGRIDRVFFAPNLQDNLFASDGGAALKGRIKFNAQPSWVRHDDHYHVDFDFPCK